MCIHTHWGVILKVKKKIEYCTCYILTYREVVVVAICRVASLAEKEEKRLIFGLLHRGVGFFAPRRFTVSMITTKFIIIL